MIAILYHIAEQLNNYNEYSTVLHVASEPGASKLTLSRSSPIVRKNIIAITYQTLLTIGNEESSPYFRVLSPDTALPFSP